MLGLERRAGLAPTTLVLVLSVLSVVASLQACGGAVLDQGADGCADDDATCAPSEANGRGGSGGYGSSGYSRGGSSGYSRGGGSSSGWRR